MAIQFAEDTAPKPKKRGLQDLAEGQGNLYAFDPRKLCVEPGWNSRTTSFDPTDEEDIALARSIAEVGVKQPLTAFLRDGQAYITDGHRRLAATLHAMDVLGAEILTVPVQSETKHASDADRVLSQLVRNQGKPLAPIEKANVYAKLIGFGWSEGEIAKKVGASRNYVSDLLKLRAGPQAVVEMVKAGEVSAGLALDTIKAARGNGAAAAETLATGLAKAKAAGKSKLTAKHVERKVPDLSKHPAYAAGLRRAVALASEFLDGQDAEGEAGEVYIARKIVDALEAEIGG